MRVLTIGTFDLPHHGHLDLFNRCSELGELTVGVNSDSFVEGYKHERPIMTEAERLKFIIALGYTALINNGAGRELIDEVRPDILAIGSDWGRKDYLSQIDVTWDWLEERSIGLLYVPRPGDISTSELKARLNDR